MRRENYNYQQEVQQKYMNNIFLFNKNSQINIKVLLDKSIFFQKKIFWILIIFVINHFFFLI